MRFLADMGVDIRVVEWLRREGHDAVHLREEGLHRSVHDPWIVPARHLGPADESPGK